MPARRPQPPGPVILDLISVFEAADLTRLNHRTIRRYIAEGKITGYRVGTKLIKVDKDEVVARLIKPVTIAG
jgi:excisionase family DNA binding protein